jgi:hypothetical protein
VLRVQDSSLYEPLAAVGLDDSAIRYVLKTFEQRLIGECADMSLAARERFGEAFFKISSQAYFMDNLKAMASKKRTLPDWWRELRKEEERRRWQADREEDKAASSRTFEAAVDAYLKAEAREAFGSVMDRIFKDLKAGGQTEPEARQNAQHYARTHFARRFRAEHPEWNHGGPA